MSTHLAACPRTRLGRPSPGGISAESRHRIAEELTPLPRRAFQFQLRSGVFTLRQRRRRSIARTGLTFVKLHYHDCWFVFQGMGGFTATFTLSAIRKAVFVARIRRRLQASRLLLFKFGHHLSHVHFTRVVLAETLYLEPKVSPGSMLTVRLPCVSSSSLGLQTETRRDGVTRPSAYRSFSLTLPTYAPSRETSLDHFSTTVSDSLNERQQTLSRPQWSAIIRAIRSARPDPKIYCCRVSQHSRFSSPI